jgi:hypothetical protein
MKKINQFLENWEWYTNDFAVYFAIKYFGKDNERWWVANEVGGVYHINDYFFNMTDMVDFVRYKYSRKQMFEYYEYSLDFLSKRKNDHLPICIRDYKKLIK